MTREDFIDKVKLKSYASILINLVDEGISIFGYEGNADAISNWYDSCYSLLNDVKSWENFKLCMAERYEKAKYILYLAADKTMTELQLNYRIDEVETSIEESIKEEPEFLEQYDDPSLIHEIASTYLLYYDYQHTNIKKLIEEQEDRAQLLSLKLYLCDNKNGLKKVTIEADNNEKQRFTIHSNTAMRLFGELFPPYFIDRFDADCQISIDQCIQQSSNNYGHEETALKQSHEDKANKTEEQLNVIEQLLSTLRIAKKKIVHRTIYEMYKVFIKKGYVPYDNDYLNANFNLNMLVPVASRDKIFKAYFNKLLYYSDSSKNIYKNLGITYVAPDYESVAHMKDVAENFGMKYNIIDPNDNTSVGLNPFIYDDPIKTSIAISSVLRRMYAAERENEGTLTIDDTATNNIVTQAIENLTLLLKEMYPRLNNGNLPNLADLLMLLNDFDKIEALAEEMNKVPELVEKYPIQLSYFKKNFYRSVSQTKREDMEKFLQASTSQLENLLRYPGVANIICNRTNNINFDKALEQGELTFVCTRRGDLGAAVQRAFGIFFLLLMQQSVLSRPGVEKSRSWYNYIFTKLITIWYKEW